MSTGAPIYLVSACASGEEFVAAFRRYADRTGLFVPVSEPLPAGKRAVVALTLKDGGVMIEGVAEVIASSVKPSALHGRVGMTIRFVEADAPSKTVLAELEKARLSMKPPPPSVPPRPAAVPPEPRPVAPAPGGRIDAANALAECVMIGDVAALREGSGKVAAPPKANQKFVIPSIPTTPGTAAAKPRDVKPTTLGIGAIDKPAATPAVPARETKATTLGIGAIDKPTPSPAPAPAAPAPAAPAPAPVPAAPVVAAAPTAPKNNPARPKSSTSPPRFPTPVVPLPITKLPAHPAPPVVDAKSAAPVQPLQEVDLAEPTDINTAPPGRDSARPFDVPTVDSGKALAPTPEANVESDKPIQPSRASQILAAVPSSGDWSMTPDAATPTVHAPSQPSPPIEPTPAPGPPPGPPTGDWTISLTDAGWGDVQKVAPTAAAPPPPPPAPPVQPKTGNPVMAVSSEKLLDTGAPEDKPTSIGPKIEIDPTLMEPLKPMPSDEDEAAALSPPPSPPPAPRAPAMPVQPIAFAPQAYPTPVPQPIAPAMMPSGMMHPATPPPGAMHPGMMMGFPNHQQHQHPRGVTDGGTGFFINDTSQLNRYPSEATLALDPDRKRTRTILIAITAVIVLLGAVIIILATRHKDTKSTTPPAAHKGSAAQPPQGSAEQVANTPPAGSNEQHAAAPGSAAAPVAPTTCSIDVQSTPSGADVALDSDKANILGTTPGTFTLPCDTETKLVLKKAKYASAVKAVTATASAQTVNVKLSRVTFAMKVTSTPAGATITVGGRSMGVTPTTIKVPAYDTLAITISKDGYAPDTQKVPVKQNNTPYHVVLKKTPGRRR